ncbi:AAA family ATPase [Bosea sp. (in: a-proteobacteria)]|uniref:AAA family ATPase n=1 Tax=Bosea sp. (in: a-proteobacteria) TaxID=1871050 RepID=UPI00261FD01B|nr:AAA family ATPase [Bosea sp. (in: a-proteobacteria)]MCO5092783.1 AAA family ATPase [Bosea sp. (in: a-proteobacteria)]
MSAADQNDDAFGFLQGPEPETEATSEDRNGSGAMAPVDLLLDLSWQAIDDFPKTGTLSAGATLVTIIQVPSSTWIDPVHHFVHENDPAAMIVDGKSKKKDWSAQENLIVDALDRGKTIFGIASDPDNQLPPLLRAAADVVITVPAPTPELMRKAIRLHTGRSRVPALDAMDIGGLDLLDLAAALRPQTTPRACVKRLMAASAARSVSTSNDATPLLRDLSGYGAARDWCLATLADIEAVRAGTLSAGELESAVFHGPPGTGKTTLARSLAKTARIPLIETSVAAWFQHREGALGDFLQQVADVFARARSAAPCVLFLDELDSLPDRAQLDSRGKSWWSSAVGGVLLECSRIREAKNGVVLLGATNHLANIDAALLRPGRFDRRFRIDPPDAAGLAGIMRSHLGEDCAEADVTALVRLMPGRTGADVAGMVREAKRFARTAKRDLTEADLRAAIMPADPRPRSELRHVAIHEAGHAVVAHMLGYKVESVTIRGEGDAGGWTDIRLPGVSDRALIEARVKILLAGRASNGLFGSPADTGATADLAEATRLLAAARLSFGLADSLVFRAGPDQALDMVSRDRGLADAIGHELNRLMISTKRLVAENRAIVERVADALLDRAVLDEAELANLIASPPMPVRRREPRLDRRPFVQL